MQVKFASFSSSRHSVYFEMHNLVQIVTGEIGKKSDLKYLHLKVQKKCSGRIKYSKVIFKTDILLLLFCSAFLFCENFLYSKSFVNYSFQKVHAHVHNKPAFQISAF